MNGIIRRIYYWVLKKNRKILVEKKCENIYKVFLLRSPNYTSSFDLGGRKIMDQLPKIEKLLGHLFVGKYKESIGEWK